MWGPGRWNTCICPCFTLSKIQGQAPLTAVLAEVFNSFHIDAGLIFISLVTGHGPKQAQFYKWYKWPQLHVSFNLLEILRNSSKFWHFFFVDSIAKKDLYSSKSAKTFHRCSNTSNSVTSSESPDSIPSTWRAATAGVWNTNDKLENCWKGKGWKNIMTEIVWQWLMSVHVSLLRHQNHWKFMKMRTCSQHLKLCSPDLNSTKEWSCSATSWGSSLSIGWHILNWSSFTSVSSTVHWHVDYMENTAIPNGKS